MVNSREKLFSLESHFMFLGGHLMKKVTITFLSFLLLSASLLSGCGAQGNSKITIKIGFWPASTELSRLPIYIDDNPSVSMDYVRTSAKLLQSKGDCDCLFIDYLQLCDMKSEQKNRNREQEVAEASRKAKLIAKELDIPVILLCQLNRECEMRADKRPALSDLRESGAIEQDADVVMLLYRPALYGLTSERKSKFPSEGLGMVILAKHRNGETGDVYFGHNPTLTKIGEYEPTLEWMARNARSSC